MIDVIGIGDLGYRPTDASDYELVFRQTPRGDTGPVIYGPNWLAFCLTDVMHDGGFWRNIIVVQAGSKFVYLKNSPNAAYPGQTLIQPSMYGVTEIDWFWPSGGWALPNGDDAVIIGNGYKYNPGLQFGELVGTYQITLKAITSPTPGLSTLRRCTLPNPITSQNHDIVWDGNACQVDDKVYLYGHRTTFGWMPIVARKVWNDHEADWEWLKTDGTWTNDLTVAPGTPQSTILQGPLCGLYVERASWSPNVYVASAKILNSAPGLGYNETPEIFMWYSPNPWGPWNNREEAIGRTDIYAGCNSYAGRVVRLNLPQSIAMWSTNQSAALGTPSYHPKLYGLHFAPIS